MTSDRQDLPIHAPRRDGGDPLCGAQRDDDTLIARPGGTYTCDDCRVNHLSWERDDGKPRRQSQYRTRYVDFKGLDDQDQLMIYLDALKYSGAYISAAQAVGCNEKEIASYRRENPEFQALCDDVLALYGQEFIAEAKRRAVDGWENPVIGGRNKDEVVAYERKYSDSLMLAFLKRVDPEGFKDRTSVKVEASVAQSFDYSACSHRVREQLRILAQMQKEDDEARARGETVV